MSHALEPSENPLRKVGRETARLYYFLEGLLPHVRWFTRQKRRLYGRLNYLEVLSFVHETRRVRRYLEIGVDSGVAFGLSRAAESYGVDPGFAIRAPLRGSIALVRQTSDRFFAQYADAPFDFIFIDGLHEASQVSRDLFNSLQHLAPGGWMAFHDSVPFNRLVATRRRYTGIWTGDVYRGLVPYIQRCEECFLSLLVPPTGLTLVKVTPALRSALPAPLPPSPLSYRECMRVIMRTARKVDEPAQLERLLAEFAARG